MKLHKIIVSLLLCITFIPLFAMNNSVTVKAAEDSIERVGGVNSFNGEEANNRAETIQLEEKVRKSGYILVSSSNKQITDEQLKIIKQYNFWFGSYLNQENKYYWENCKIYLYVSDYNSLMTEHKKNPYSAKFDLCEQISCSTVAINYTIWDSEEKAGKLSSEYGNKIPERYLKTSGYLKVNSTVTVKITLRDNLSDQYYAFYVKKDEPYTVKMKAGMYEIICINTQEIPRGDEALTYIGFFRIDNNNTESEPYELDIQSLINEYDIKEYEKEEVERFPNVIIRKNTYREDVAAYKSQKRKEQLKQLATLICIVIAFTIIITKGIIYIKKKIKAEKELRDLIK